MSVWWSEFTVAKIKQLPVHFFFFGERGAYEELRCSLHMTFTCSLAAQKLRRVQARREQDDAQCLLAMK